MPKLNTSNESVQTFLLDVATYWIREYDIDGWRLDVSDEVSHDFWRKFRVAVKHAKQDCLIVGENWHDAYPYLMGDQYDCIMNYAFTKACLDYFVNKAIDADGMAGRLCKLLMRNTDMVNAMMVNLLDSHDTHRFLTLAEGNTDTLLAALALMFMYTGVPQIYYGTEIFMEGGYDPDCRRTFDWSKTPAEQIAALIALKKTAALQSNDLWMSAEDGVLVMRKGETVLYHNASYEPVDVPKNMHILWGNSYDSGRIMPNGVIICGNMSAQ
jgi:glycosidase